MKCLMKVRVVLFLLLMVGFFFQSQAQSEHNRKIFHKVRPWRDKNVIDKINASKKREVRKVDLRKEILLKRNIANKKPWEGKLVYDNKDSKKEGLKQPKIVSPQKGETLTSYIEIKGTTLNPWGKMNVKVKVIYKDRNKIYQTKTRTAKVKENGHWQTYVSMYPWNKFKQLPGNPEIKIVARQTVGDKESVSATRYFPLAEKKEKVKVASAPVFIFPKNKAHVSYDKLTGYGSKRVKVKVKGQAGMNIHLTGTIKYKNRSGRQESRRINGTTKVGRNGKGEFRNLPSFSKSTYDIQYNLIAQQTQKGYKDSKSVPISFSQAIAPPSFPPSDFRIDQKMEAGSPGYASVIIVGGSGVSGWKVHYKLTIKYKKYSRDSWKTKTFEETVPVDNSGEWKRDKHFQIGSFFAPRKNIRVKVEARQIAPDGEQSATVIKSL